MFERNDTKGIKYIVVSILIILLSQCECKTAEEASQEGVDANNYVEVLFCGDIMLDWGIKNIIDKYGFDYPLRKLKKFLSTFDYRFCNLEGPISEEGEPHISKKYIFLTHPDLIQIMIDGMINGVTLANNHANDFGDIALLNTMSNLSFSGIHYTGAGIDAETAHLPILLNIRNIRIAIFGYTDIAYKISYASDTKPGISRATLSLIKRDIKKFKSFNDFIIISLHWGIEYSSYPTEKQRKLAHAIIDSGADAIIGHHPHIYQGIEIYQGKPIVYSLGNFIFGSINEDIGNNILVAIRFTKEKIDLLRVIPINGNNGAKNHFQYNILDKNKATELFSHLIEISKPLGLRFPDSIIQEDSFLYYHFFDEELLDEDSNGWRRDFSIDSSQNRK
jgi:poly-gamma-glutamate capsule biosynthesis protein CapA/YwtB (metallophosphatase superfamily)